MLDIRFVCDNIDQIEKKLLSRGESAQLEEIKKLAKERSNTIYEYEKNQQILNKNKHLMAKLDKKSEEFAQKRDEMKTISKSSKDAKAKLNDIMDKLQSLILYIPNLPQDSVPIGKDETENVVVRYWGEKPKFDFEPKPHWDYTNLLDFEKGAKITGAKFTVLNSNAAKLERALINLMLDTHGETGYQEVFVPFMVNRKSMTGTGQLPKFEDDAFKIEDTDYFLIPTAEVPVTNLYSDEIIAEKDLPLNMVAYTACFRKEAGAAGKDTRGLIRQHQFNKVELVSICKPEDSLKIHENILKSAESILQKLNIHYRVIELCTGDLGFSASKCYDIEVWLPAQNSYREISSISNFLDFQSRRAKIRYKDGETGKNKLVHTLNGSGLAIGRTMVAVIENYQQKDGSILIPEALKKYMNVDKI